MKRNSTTLFLESPGATTPIPWVESAPDLSGFTEPTLSVLQQSWATFLESGEELEVIPDPVPTTPQPDWDGFLTPFYLPDMSSSPYNSIERKVQEAWVTATKLPTEAERDAALHAAMSLRTHWYNCSVGLTNSSIRSPGWLIRTWNDLKALMELSQVPLSGAETQVIEDLFKQHHLM